jgi:hypothetical protein
MTLAKQIDTLWEQFQQAIETAYEEGNSEVRTALCDYRECSWSHDLDKLVERESVNERQHRRGSPTGWKAPISAYSAAKMLLMNNAVDGTKLKKMPPATIFMNFRQTAAEGIVLGYLVQKHLSEQWRQEVSALDYSKIMNKGWN